MLTNIQTTASVLRGVLAFINPENTTKIAYDRDDLALPLIEKVKEMVRDYDGSQSVTIRFNEGEENLFYQFHIVCENIAQVFAGVTAIIDVTANR